ncbi:DUF397 domain-containing protein [Actinocorallia aurea]
MRESVIWHKSSHSDNGGLNCVEVASRRNPGTDAPSVATVAVRDSKNPGEGVLELSRRAWRAFSGGVKTRA